jgi:hypothetical protein
MVAETLATLYRAGRWLLLLVLAGHLLLRQGFAHRSLGELPLLIGLKEPISFLAHAYVTEVALLALLPLAAIILWRRHFNLDPIRPGAPPLQDGVGIATILCIAFIVWGALHAFYAIFFGQDRSMYLVLRQSALAAYAIFFIYTFLLFQGEFAYVRRAAIFLVCISVLCAVIDTAAWFIINPVDPASREAHPWLAYFRDLPYGQETLPIAILGLAFFIVCVPGWILSVAALALMGFVGWRQGLRFQSVVPLSMAGALVAYLLLSLVALARGQEHTAKRAVLLLALFGILGGAYKMIPRKQNVDAPTDENTAEVKAWSPKIYSDLFDIYQRTQAPVDSAQQVHSTRSHLPVSDPEVYKLNAVFDASPNLSIRNNIWRFLVWRRMALDWKDGRPLVGAGVGRKWFYDALYHTSFHYGEDNLGLDPHNSYLNLLYRYGLVGLLLTGGVVVLVLASVLRVLRLRRETGDPLMEGLTLYFFYTLFFGFFTVALEGPSYALPFWVSLGLVYTRARQIIAAHRDSVA